MQLFNLFHSGYLLHSIDAYSLSVTGLAYSLHFDPFYCFMQLMDCKWWWYPWRDSLWCQRWWQNRWYPSTCIHYTPH